VTVVSPARELSTVSVFQQVKRSPAAEVFEAMALAKAGRREEAVRLIRPFEEKFPNPGVSMEWFALVYAFLGDEPNTGFRTLEKRIGLDR
jgi:hypothetical protein